VVKLDHKRHLKRNGECIKKLLHSIKSSCTALLQDFLEILKNLYTFCKMCKNPNHYQITSNMGWLFGLPNYYKIHQAMQANKHTIVFVEDGWQKNFRNIRNLTINKVCQKSFFHLEI